MANVSFLESQSISSQKSLVGTRMVPRAAVERFGSDRQTQMLMSLSRAEPGLHVQLRTDPRPRTPAPGKVQARRCISATV